MRHVAVLAKKFQLKEMVRSLFADRCAACEITVALYWIFFEFPGDVDYFAATGGFALLVVSAGDNTLLAGQANRMNNTPLITHLPHRSELLGAES